MKKNAGEVGDFPIKSPTPYYLNNTSRAIFERARSALRQYGIGDILDRGTGEVSMDALRTLSRFHSDSRHGIISTVRDVNSFNHWESYREVYFFHSKMTSSLMSMKADNATIPGSTLKKLRHINPFIVTPAMPSFTHADGQPGRVMGFYVSGAIAEGYPRSPTSKVEVDFSTPSPYRRSVTFDTNFEDINSLHVMVVSEVLSSDYHEIIDYDICNMTVPVIGEFTLKELTDKTSRSFSWSRDLKGPGSTESRENYLSVMSRLVTSHLLYATSRSFECDKPNPTDRPFTKKKAARKASPPPRIYPVGYRMGAAIENTYRNAGQPRERDEGVGITGRVMPAHIRAPHTHLYRVGPGRSEVDIKFLGPIPVNQHLDDGEITTLHPVR